MVPCLHNINLISPNHKMEILQAQSKIISWSVAAFREHILVAEQPRRNNKLKDKGSLNEGIYNWLRKMPWARSLCCGY